MEGEGGVNAGLWPRDHSDCQTVQTNNAASSATNKEQNSKRKVKDEDVEKRSRRAKEETEAATNEIYVLQREMRKGLEINKEIVFNFFAARQ